MYHFEKCNEPIEFPLGVHETSCFQTKEWFEYQRQSRCKLLTIKVQNKKNEKFEDVAYILGIRKNLGIKIFCSPIGGFGSLFQGLIRILPISEDEIIEIYSQLAKWIFHHRYASYIQIGDWNLRKEYDNYQDRGEWKHPILEKTGIHYSNKVTYYLDTNQPIEKLWANLSYKSCKYCINKALKENLIIKRITKSEEIDDFVERHYKQVLDVCKRKGNRPQLYQKKSRIHALCHNLFPNKILLYEVMGSGVLNNIYMSSAIFCLGDTCCSYHSGASYHEYMKYCPNEIMVWSAIQDLHQLGYKKLILGDISSYKKKFGPSYAYLPILYYSKYEFAIKIRRCIKKIYAKWRNKKLLSINSIRFKPK